MYLGENMEYDFLLDDKRCKGTEGSIKTEPDSRLYSIEEEIVGNLLEEDELLDGSKELKQEFQDYNFPLTLDDTTDQMMHQTENHTVITPFSCDECVKSFVSSRLLTRHISKTGHVSRKRARCFLCSATDHDVFQCPHVDCGVTVVCKAGPVQSCPTLPKCLARWSSLAI